MNILSPLYATGFGALHIDENKEAEIAVEEMLFKILYLENSDKAIFFI